MKAYINASIYTMDEKNLRCSYMIVEGDKILEVGSDFKASEYFEAISDENIIDLKGKTVIPGFWESHLHIVDGIRSLVELNLRNISTIEQLKERIQAFALNTGKNDWIIGHGWDESRIFGGSFPDKTLLDSLNAVHPVMLIRMDGHSLCLNTKGIEAAGVDKMPKNSEIPYDELGLPTGMLFENAANEAAQKISESFSEEYIERLVLKAQELFLQNGITSVNDICTKYGRLFDIYRKLQKDGKLKIRITTSSYGMDTESLIEFDDRKCDETDSLRIAAPKYFMDGSFGSRTALLFEEYSDTPGSYGHQLLEREELKEIIIQNENINQPINIHAIGDKAVNIILDCVEQARVNNNRDIRSRIEHIQIVRDSDIDRFRKLDITASFQPVFLYEKELTESRLGRERFGSIYRFKSFIDKGINVIFNSDFPYGGGAMPSKKDSSSYIGFEPILGIHAACYKQLNEMEAVNPEQALKCYTANAAFANYREGELGRLRKGYLADFVVLSEDILQCSPADLLNTEILMTCINGEAIYKK